MTDPAPIRPGVANRPERTKPALASRIAIAGLSASAGFGLVAAMEAAKAADDVELVMVPSQSVPVAAPITVLPPSTAPAPQRIVRVVVVAAPPAAATAAPSSPRPSRSAPSRSSPSPSSTPAAQPAPAPVPAPTTVSKSS